MHGTLVLAGADLTVLTRLAAEAGTSFGSPLLIQSRRPVDNLTSKPVHDANAAIVWLNGCENVVELRALLEANPGACFVLLTQTYPPHAAFARIAGQHGAAILPANESSLVINATLIALLSRHAATAV